jgi:aldose sugar dehydrogenase
MRLFPLALIPALALAGCNGTGDAVVSGNAAAPEGQTVAADGRPFTVEELGRFSEPWAMTFLPNGILLVTEKRGNIRFIDFGPSTPRLGSISGVPQVAYGGQGGLGDIVAHPQFAENNLVYISYAEAGQGGTGGAVVARARLVLDEADAGRLENLQVIWRQQPKVTGQGHYAHRLAFSPDGRHLFISSGDRQKLDPAQDNSSHLGTIVRLNADGSTPPDNPFAGQGTVQGQIWSYGHRNPLGIAFAPDGRLWSHEMGPRHGDEFNLIQRGRNYGWPVVSDGDHYEGRPIPDHATRPEFEAPKIAWVPAISPAGLIIYNGAMFPEWRGHAFLGGLSGQTLVRVEISGDGAREAQRWDMGARIREVEQAPDGAILVLEDERGGSGGRLLRLARPR